MPGEQYNSYQDWREEQVTLTFGSHEQLLPDLVPVRVTEVNDSQRSAAAGVVDDVTDDTLGRRRVRIRIVVEIFQNYKDIENKSQTAHTGGLITTLWVQLFQAQGQK